MPAVHARRSTAWARVAGVAARWTGNQIADELPRLLDERGLTQRALAREVGIDQAHISRITRRETARNVSGDVASRIAVVLGLPADYFPETREAAVIDEIKRDSSLRDRLYRRLSARS